MTVSFMNVPALFSYANQPFHDLHHAPTTRDRLGIESERVPEVTYLQCYVPSAFDRPEPSARAMSFGR